MPTKSLLQTSGSSAHQTPRARCGQCGRELRHVPFDLKNIMCRDCYGLDRYRRTAPATWTAPEKPIEVVVTDEEVHV